MTIESADITDAEALLEIYAPYVEDTAISFEYEVPSVEEFRKRIREISVKYPYLKAVEDVSYWGRGFCHKDRPLTQLSPV